ncbi:hypothetical protein V1512DRAFT_262474 [Lipomyces arxii]|uniref:uncharacterized protein n=1 Tax=Lipomyces arxii TaxID=56418 RepID=UPI0034CF436A
MSRRNGFVPVTSTAFAKLPYEIHSMILVYADALSWDAKKIGPNIYLARVCLMWREIIQSVLFSKIAIKVGIETEPELDRFNGSNLVATEVIFKRNPFLATYVKEITISFLPKKGDKKDTVTLTAATVKAWGVVALIAEPRIRRTNNLLFGQRSTELKIKLVPALERNVNNIQLLDTFINFPNWKRKLARIEHTPVELDLTDSVMRGRKYDPEVLSLFVNSVGHLTKLKLGFMRSSKVHSRYREIYPRILKCIQTLPPSLTSLEIDMRCQLRNLQGDIGRDVFETPIYSGGTGDRLNRLLRKVAHQLTYFKYQGPVTPELFGELPELYTRFDDELEVATLGPIEIPDGPSPYVPKSEITFPHLEQLHIRFDMYDSLGLPYFEHCKYDHTYVIREEEFITQFVSDGLADHIMSSSLDLRSYIPSNAPRRWQNLDEPQCFMPLAEPLGKLSRAYTDAVCNRMPSLKQFSIRDYVGVMGLLLISDAKELRPGFIKYETWKDLNKAPLLFIRRFKPASEDVEALKNRFRGEKEVQYIEDNIKVVAKSGEENSMETVNRI